MDDSIRRQVVIDAMANQNEMHPKDRIIAVEVLDALPSAQPDTIPVEWIRRYADDWEDMNYPYDNPILGMLKDWRGE